MPTSYKPLHRSPRPVLYDCTTSTVLLLIWTASHLSGSSGAQINIGAALLVSKIKHSISYQCHLANAVSTQVEPLGSGLLCQ